MKFDLETAAALAFLIFFVWVIWRQGSTNPVGTGQLQKQLNTIGSKVGALETSLDNCALKTDITQLRGEISDMRAGLASSGEVVALEGQIAAVNARISGIEKLAERTDAGVARLESYFLERGINK